MSPIATYYFGCHKCGYHTASVELLARCPNCKSDRRVFHRITTTEEPDFEEKVRMFIASAAGSTHDRLRAIRGGAQAGAQAH